MPKTVVVIGGGPGGYSSAIYAAKLGLEVTLVEQRGTAYGGTCLNEGCIPTKAFVQAASTYAEIQSAARYGISIEGTVAYDWKKMLQFKRKIIKQQQNGIKHLLRSAKVNTVSGRGELLSPHSVKVVSEQGEQVLEADAIILSTGSREIEIPGFAADGVSIVNSTQMLEMESLPESLIVIGGGVIGVEFASILSQMKKKVIIVELSPRIIPTEDAEISALLRENLERQGVEVLTETQAIGVVSKNETGIEIQVKGPDGEIRALGAEKVLVCVGRKANIDNIGLGNVGLSEGARRLETSPTMQTAVESIYAIGDITNSPQLAHVAYHEAKVAAQAIAGFEVSANYSAIPSCIFSHPEVARVGMTEDEARRGDDPVVVEKVSFVGNGRAMISGENSGIIKLVMVGHDKKLVGVSIIGPKATELIAEPSLAVQMRLPVDTVADVIHAHPSLSETIGEAAGAASGLGLHS